MGEKRLEELLRSRQLGTVDGTNPIDLSGVDKLIGGRSYIDVIPYIYKDKSDFERIQRGISNGRRYGCQGIFCDECTWSC